MKKRTPVTLVYILIIFLAVLSGGRSSIAGRPRDLNPADRSLWDRAVGIAEQQKCLIPGHIQDIETTWNEDGEKVENSLTRYRVVESDENKLDVELVSRLENGKDRTASFQDEFAESKATILDAIDEGFLFRQAFQDKIKLISLTISGNKALYTFELTLEKSVFRGKAGIDVQTGSALYSSVSCSRLKEDGVTIRNFIEQTWYTNKNSAWHPEKIVQTMEIETAGLLFSFKGKIKEETLLKDFFCHEKD